MTLPRIVVPNSCLLITRRCFGRQFLLRPDPDVVGLFVKVLSKAAAQFGVTILGAVQMSNHYHLVVHDKHGRYPDFVGWVNASLTRGINRLRGRVDTMWEARQTSVVELADAESVLEALAYVHLNPMAAGLVSAPTTWLGLVTGPDDLEPQEGAGAGRSGLQVHVPPTHAHMRPGDFAALLRARIRDRADRIRANMELQGRTFGTPEKALKVAWQAAPHQSLGLEEKEGDGGWYGGKAADGDEDDLLEAVWGRIGDDAPEMSSDASGTTEGLHCSAEAARRFRPSRINPTVKAASARQRAGVLARLRAFRDAYAGALKRLRQGLSAIFPGGTWLLCRTLKLPARPAPVAAWQLS